MENRNKLKWCVFFNFLSLMCFLSLLGIFESTGNGYWNIGPNPKLTIISVPIDTWNKYFTLLLLISMFNITQVVISEIAHPILQFSIYNPDKIVITDFTRNELQFYANTMYMIDAVRNALLIMITISQVDIAVFGAIVSEVTGIFTVRKLLNEKIFTTRNDIYNQI